jgi:hypothetical protein
LEVNKGQVMYHICETIRDYEDAMLTSMEGDKIYCSCKLWTQVMKSQPERLNPKALEEGFFPPPWDIYEHPEKTEGWIEFQREMRKDPKYYLQGCDSPNTANK